MEPAAICRGCLSTDRKLFPLAHYELYWALLKEDQRMELLSIPHIVMCWECAAALRRTHKFQLQVQKAHTILQDSLGLMPPKQCLSQLSIQQKQNYDANFNESVALKNLPIWNLKIPVTNVNQYGTSFTEHVETVQNDTSDTEDTKETENVFVKTSSILRYEPKQKINDEYKIEDSVNNIEDHENDNKLVKPRRSLRKAVRHCTQISEKRKKEKKGGKIRNKVAKPKKTEFIAPPSNKLIGTKILSLNEVESSNDGVSDMEIDDNNIVDEDDSPLAKEEDKRNPVSYLNSPVLARLEIELKKLIKKPSTTAEVEKQKKSQNIKKDDMDYEPFSGDESSGSEHNVKLKESNNPHSNLKEERPKSDPDFSPDADVSIQKEKSKEPVDDTKKKRNNVDRNRAKKIIMRYEKLEDVLQYFTEIEMSEEEFKSTLEKEDEIVNSKKPMKCYACGMIFPFRRTLVRHLRYTHKIRDARLSTKIKIPLPPEKPSLWQCSICSRMLRREHIVAHMNGNHRNQFFCNGQGCEWCPKIFWSRASFEAHWGGIHKQFLCDVCGRRHVRKPAIEWHMQEKHLQTFSQQCSLCPNVYTTRSALYNHVRLAHPAPAPAELRYCVECDVTFRSTAHYTLHIHSKHSVRTKRKWPCPECGRVLRDKTTMLNHVALYHRGATDYQCEICGKYLSKKAALEGHLDIHRNIKVPKTKPCTVCGRMFQSNRILRHHMYTHTGERPYKCDQCPASYNQPYCLKLHLAKRHEVLKSVPEAVPAATDTD